MYSVHTHTSAIRTLLYGCAYVREIIHSLVLVDYLPVLTYKPYNNLHLLWFLDMHYLGLDVTKSVFGVFDKV